MVAPEIRSKYQLIIGLEVHAQLLTKTKIFSGEANAFGSQPNTNISVVSLGHPGSMPKLNKKAVELAIRMGLACNCEITRFGYFDRKNYFYPDLPKGYQITQDKSPICVGGYVPIFQVLSQCQVKLNRIHLEEDAGKSIHVDGQPDSLIDLNRAGVPLIEIVTEPEIYSAEAAGAFLSEIRKLVRYLGVSDGNMEEGSLRCDANVSIRRVGDPKLGKKVEVKNMNSIRNVMRAIDHETNRQIELLELGEAVVSETRTFDADRGTTAGMRTKEELNDYRYFPDPDLSPLQVSEEWLQEIRAVMPELPSEKMARWKSAFGLSDYDATVLVDQKEMAHYFDQVCSSTTNYKGAANWVMGPLKSYVNDHSIRFDELPVKPETVAEIIQLIDDSKITYSVATQQLLPELITSPLKRALDVAVNRNLLLDTSAGDLTPIIQEVLAAMPAKVKEYKGGKRGLIGLFIGEVMKKTNGKVDPKEANKRLMEALEA